MNWIKLIQEQNVTLLIIFIMVMVGIFKNNNISIHFCNILSSKIKNKKVLLSLLSTIFGILPIPGRISVTSAIFDSMTDNKKDNSQLGIVSYLATHHYYLWLPIEKSVILPMSILGLTYFQFISYTWIPIVISLLFCVGYISFFVKDTEINFLTDLTHNYELGKVLDSLLLIFCIIVSCFTKPFIVFGLFVLYLTLKYKESIQDIFGYVNWILVGFVFSIVCVSQFIGQYSQVITDHLLLNSLDMTIPVLVCLSFGASFLFGSSSRFASISSLITKVIGIQYFPLFFVADYCGYLLSPVHKCVGIATLYFKTSIFKMYVVLSILCATLLGVTFFNYLG